MGPHKLEVTTLRCLEYASDMPFATGAAADFIARLRQDDLWTKEEVDVIEARVNRLLRPMMIPRRIRARSPAASW